MGNPGFDLSTNTKPGIVAQSHDHRTWEVNAGGLEVQGNPQLYSEFMTSLRYMRPDQTKTKPKNANTDLCMSLHVVAFVFTAVLLDCMYIPPFSCVMDSQSPG